jgi:hypothetical protein
MVDDFTVRAEFHLGDPAASHIPKLPIDAVDLQAGPTRSGKLDIGTCASRGMPRGRIRRTGTLVLDGVQTSPFRQPGLDLCLEDSFVRLAKNRVDIHGR